MGILWSILISIAAGAIAGWITKGSGFGIFLNLIIGIIGGLLGGWIFSSVGLTAYGMMGSLLSSVVGAVVLLWIISLFQRKNREE